MDRDVVYLPPSRSALLLVDLQNGTCGAGQETLRPGFHALFRQRTLPAARLALADARSAGAEVIHTVIANLTADGRDRSLDYKRCGMGFPPGSSEARVIDHTVKDAADRGYRMVCLHDACMAESLERHEAALACFRGYAQQLRVKEIIWQE